MFATPIAHLIDEAGFIMNEVPVGTGEIQDLMTRAEHMRTGTQAVV